MLRKKYCEILVKTTENSRMSIEQKIWGSLKSTKSKHNLSTLSKEEKLSCHNSLLNPWFSINRYTD